MPFSLFQYKRLLDKNKDLSCSYLKVLSRVLKESTKRIKTHVLNLKPNQKWGPSVENKAATTTTKRTRLENKSAEIKTQTMTQTICTYLRHRIKIHIEGPLTSEALKFLSSRMSHYACWPPFS